MQLITETQANPDEWNLTEAAMFLRKSEGTLKRWLAQGRMPRPTRCGKSLRFNVAEIKAWAAQGYPLSQVGAVKPQGARRLVEA